MLISPKVINLVQLGVELNNAGIAHRGLGGVVDDDGLTTAVCTYDEDGSMIDVPESARLVINNHVPEPKLPTPDERISALEILVLQLGGVI